MLGLGIRSGIVLGIRLGLGLGLVLGLGVFKSFISTRRLKVCSEMSISYESFCIHVLPSSVDETAFEPELPDDPEDDPLDGGVVAMVVVVIVVGGTVV